MKTDELSYHLPPELIAQQPVAVRSDSKLLVLNRATVELTDSRFSSISRFLLPGDCLVLNDTKVLPARFFARRASGAKLEALFLKLSAPRTWLIMLKGARKVKPGEKIYLRDKLSRDFCDAVLLEKLNHGRCVLKIESDSDPESILEQIGLPPLPPYIKRTDDPQIAEKDKQRYQTVYAHNPGAVAAPTAGLHLTEQLIEQLKKAQIRFAKITLHVGAGTFKPVTEENLEDHKIHSERFSIDEENARIINTAKKQDSRIIAVGTTSVRTLETAAQNSNVLPADTTTSLFITPSYKFKIVDAIITNFHLPGSTLLALIAAFAGLKNTHAAYRHAIAQKYRFYSYGDAMLII